VAAALQREWEWGEGGEGEQAFEAAAEAEDSGWWIVALLFLFLLSSRHMAYQSIVRANPTIRITYL